MQKKQGYTFLIGLSLGSILFAAPIGQVFALGIANCKEHNPNQTVSEIENLISPSVNASKQLHLKETFPVPQQQVKCYRNRNSVARLVLADAITKYDQKNESINLNHKVIPYYCPQDKDFFHLRFPQGESDFMNMSCARPGRIGDTGGSIPISKVFKASDLASLKDGNKDEIREVCFFRYTMREDNKTYVLSYKQEFKLKRNKEGSGFIMESQSTGKL